MNRRIARAPGLREVVVCAMVLTALAAVTFGPQVRHGGFYGDDWAFAVDAHFDKPTYIGAVRSTLRETGDARPVLSVVHPVPHLLFPNSPGSEIALGLVLGIATCLTFFIVLRMLGLRSLPATLMACLALVFPWADSIRLWVAGALNTVALLLLFLGVIAALAGLARRGRSSLALHAVAVAGALQLTRRDKTLQAFPVFDDDTVTCGARKLVVSGSGSFGRNEIAYGRLFFVSPSGHRRVTDRASCQSALAAFPLGPRTT